MEQDNETYEKPAGKPTLAKWIPDRIQEVRMLLEKYPLYKPAHLELIALLRRKNVVFASRESQSELESVRNYACEKMQLGEEEWFKWLEDEIAVCQPYDLEAMLKVIDLCVRAIEEQPMSAKLWQVYVQFVETQYRATHQDSSRNGKISAEEAEIAEGMAEMFTQEMLFNVYAQAAEATKNHITQSHLLWNRYLELLLEDLDSQFSESKLNHCRNAFLTRLKTPHPDIDQTFAAFSTFITRYENATYEKTMVATNKLYIQSKFKYQDREMQELKLKRAKEAADDEPSDENINYEWYAWQEYLQCEIALPKRKQDIDLICALFERCIMRYDFKGDSMWEWYLDFMAEKANRSPRVLPILERATHAFPALPSFWSRYLVAMEARFKTFEEMQDVKNRAVDTLSKVGEAALLDILYTWSGIIKRRVVEGQAGMSEDERASNLAEIKNLLIDFFHSQTEFRNLDAEARIERLFISLCTQLQSPNLDAARKTWKAVVANGSRAKSSKLWLKYYQWELQFGPRSDAAGVLRRACAKAGTIDDPAAIFEAYATHVAEWGDVTEAEEYHWKVRKWRENLPQVVAPVVVQATEATQVAQPEVTFNAPAATVPNAELTSPNKRRRSIGAEDGIPPSKKSKAVAAVEELALEPVPEQPQSGKRDRENSTAVVKNLPVDIKELRLRQFFRECGEINSIKVVAEPDGATATATIEFESKEDVLAAQTKDMKSIDGQAIEVTIGAGLTLYVTNFPPSADEEYIKELFKEHGEIVDVRFPSLKYNTHRRFCYVQFLSADSARAATKLDGKKLGPKETLVVKISDPTHKQERSGPIYSGREVFLRNIDFKASDSDIRALFEKELGEGTVETVRLPSKIPGRHQGFGFVVFTTKEDAEKALELNNTQLKERALSIRLSGTNFSKKPDSGIVKDLNGEHAAASPGVMSDHPSPTTADGKPSQPPSMEVIQRKTLAILNLPDTVNDTRLRELFEKHGSLRKVQLRPEHQGAIIEYDDVQDAGKAGLALEGYKFPGMTEGIRFGTVKELKRQTSEVKVEKKERPKGKGKGKSKENGGAKDSSGASGIFGAPMQALRSTYGVATRGQKRRGGLGFVSSLGRTVKEDGESSAEKKPGEATKDTSTPAEAPKAKSNSDFRSLFLKK
ncbi:hypothetical protein DFH27DRAFT_475100 [Peziza echinospora]|nr:hypothetical protein DFH27DRAFT_475100 [Peziza echinospora]